MELKASRELNEHPPENPCGMSPGTGNVSDTKWEGSVEHAVSQLSGSRHFKPPTFIEADPDLYRWQGTTQESRQEAPQLAFGCAGRTSAGPFPGEMQAGWRGM
ncbi:hypothetical protein GCM10009095_03210 [Sphingomonas molluscorum]|nr:hypothetical protein GCM10017606_13650 [Microbacterium terregens]